MLVLEVNNKSRPALNTNGAVSRRALVSAGTPMRLLLMPGFRGWVREGLITINTVVGLQASMNVHVRLETGTLGETLVAYIASEGAFPGMSPLVALPVTVTTKSALAGDVNQAAELACAFDARHNVKINRNESGESVCEKAARQLSSEAEGREEEELKKIALYSNPLLTPYPSVSLLDCAQRDRPNPNA